MTTTSTPLPSVASWPLALTVLLWLVWLAILLVADFLGFMMFAFADSPNSAQAAKLMIGPIFVWFGITFVAGVLLLIFKGWWQIPLAFVLAISPPFMVFAGYNLLMGSRSSSAPDPSLTTILAPPTRTHVVPPGGFRPTPTSQPNFQAEINKYKPDSSTRPTR